MNFKPLSDGVMISDMWQMTDAPGDACIGARKDVIWGISNYILLKVFHCCCFLHWVFVVVFWGLFMLSCLSLQFLVSPQCHVESRNQDPGSPVAAGISGGESWVVWEPQASHISLFPPPVRRFALQL